MYIRLLDAIKFLLFCFALSFVTPSFAYEIVGPYMKKDGTIVAPYIRGPMDGYEFNNKKSNTRPVNEESYSSTQILSDEDEQEDVLSFVDRIDSDDASE